MNVEEYADTRRARHGRDYSLSARTRWSFYTVVVNANNAQSNIQRFNTNTDLNVQTDGVHTHTRSAATADGLPGRGADVHQCTDRRSRPAFDCAGFAMPVGCTRGDEDARVGVRRGAEDRRL
jgi:hypothetical protein